MEPNFREEHRRVVAALVRKFGSRHLESALDAAQEAFLAAVQTWPDHGAPENSTAWLIRIAERRMLDRLRLERRESELEESVAAGGIETDELTLYRMACSSRLSRREQVCLVLRTCAGLTACEIARLLHETEEAVQRRISRAKEKLSPQDLVPSEDWETLLLVFYLIFTEGHEAGRGEEAVRWDLILTAIRLAEAFSAALGRLWPSLEALLALMYLHSSRIRVRIVEDGSVRLMDEQDPGAVDADSVRKGFWHLERAQAGKVLSRYHLEAGLAASIVRQAPASEIRRWHELLIEHFPTPMGRLSLALALGNEKGWEVGLEALQQLEQDPVLQKSAHFWGALGHANAQLGYRELATEQYRRAIACGMAQPTQRSFERRITELQHSR